MSPRISVVIPVHNGARYLRESIGSALSQTLPPWEVIVVDDGSTDGSSQLAAAFGPPVRVICQPHSGESVARNRGIENAEGDWIAFLDADDVWQPNKLAEQAEFCRQDVDCIHTNFYFFGDTSGTVDVSETPPPVRYSLPHVARRNPFRISSVMIRKTLPVRFPEWTQDGEDLLFFMDLCLYARIELVPSFLTGYRVHGAGQSRAPNMLVRRFQSLLAYLRSRPQISQQEADQVLQSYVDLMAEGAVMARYLRRWDEYWCLKHFLLSHPHLLTDTARRVAQERVFPRFVYSIKDFLQRVV